MGEVREQEERPLRQAERSRQGTGRYQEGYD